MQKGLVYVVFGEEYDKLAAHTISYSQQFTDLPICILTNLEERHSKWKDTKNVNFTYIPLSRKDNREIRTTVIKYSPFDLSLFMDCDSVIQKEGIEKVFDLIEENDLLLNLWNRWSVGCKVINLYKKMMIQVNIKLPINIYNGGFIGFRKNEQVLKFFDLWNQYWKISGRGRDMPALACAVKNSNVQVKEIISGREEIWCAKKNTNVIIQHSYGSNWCTAFGIPKFKTWRPFDKNVEEDWEMVLFE